VALEKAERPGCVDTLAPSVALGQVRHPERVATTLLLVQAVQQAVDEQSLAGTTRPGVGIGQGQEVAGPERTTALVPVLHRCRAEVDDVTDEIVGADVCEVRRWSGAAPAAVRRAVLGVATDGATLSGSGDRRLSTVPNHGHPLVEQRSQPGELSTPVDLPLVGPVAEEVDVTNAEGPP
jgi:hypothetical protein